ncbi:CTP synthetase, partial [Leptospira borgpetersenii serovar Hardjo-bovis]|nr:CTP synthetase [Leptospira borgpetersenii serovar Hardjo-bovis]
MGMEIRETNFAECQKRIKRVLDEKQAIQVTIVAKYNAGQNAYRSIFENLSPCRNAYDTKIELVKIGPDNLKKKNVQKTLMNVYEVLVPGGCGDSGIERRHLHM